MPGAFSDHPAAGDPQHGSRKRDDADAHEWAPRHHIRNTASPRWRDWFGLAIGTRRLMAALDSRV